MRSNLTIVMLLGLLAFLVNLVFGGGPGSDAEEDSGPGRAVATTAPEPAEAIRDVRVEWGSWRESEPVESDPAAEILTNPEKPGDVDPRLEAVLRDLQNVDVYVEKEMGDG